MRGGEHGAYYAPMDDSVHLNIREVARGDSIHTPYGTLFHEYGHMTDYLIAPKLQANTDIVLTRISFRALMLEVNQYCEEVLLVDYLVGQLRMNWQDTWHAFSVKTQH